MNFVKKNISTIVMALVGIAAVLYMNNRGPSSEKIKALSGDANTIWVDVREKEEVAEGTLKSAFWIPLSALQSDENSANQLISELDKSKKLLVYCRSGNRSATASGILTKMGFQVENAGGFDKLAKEGLPTVQPSNPIPGKPSL